MAKVHCLTVGNGDCTLIEHASGRVTMVDICGGNRTRQRNESSSNYMATALTREKVRGNFAMCNSPTNPLDYIQNNRLTNIFRFILTHPDMDHMDGFNNLMNIASVSNFWDSGAKKDKPSFSGSPYNESDWDRYIKVRDGKEDGTTSSRRLAGSEFMYANSDDQGGGGDFISIASPDATLIDSANEKQEFNDASYILVYRSAGGKIVIPGDSEDNSWEYALNHHKELLRDVKFLLAPHHGRDSGRDRSFLNHLNPTLSLLGCAPSKDLAYDAWSNRNLDYVTQNQVGNMVLDIRSGAIDIYIESENFAEKSGGDTSRTNSQGYFYLDTI